MLSNGIVENDCTQEFKDLVKFVESLNKDIKFECFGLSRDKHKINTKFLTKLSLIGTEQGKIQSIFDDKKNKKLNLKYKIKKIFDYELKNTIKSLRFSNGKRVIVRETKSKNEYEGEMIVKTKEKLDIKLETEEGKYVDIESKEAEITNNQDKVELFQKYVAKKNDEIVTDIISNAT